MGVEMAGQFQSSQRVGVAKFVASQVYGVPIEEMLATTRRRPQAALARQVAMYLARMVFDLSLRELSREFGRDPSTTRHACLHVERMRENREFDHTLAFMESMVRRAAGDAS